MTQPQRFITRFLLLGLLLVPFACTGDEANCVDLCQEAQAKDCTAITGNCGAFCDALLNVENDAGCADERATYQDCLNSKSDVCDGCSAAENALSNCVGNYCLGHSGDPDCQTLLDSYQ